MPQTQNSYCVVMNEPVIAASDLSAAVVVIWNLYLSFIWTSPSCFWVVDKGTDGPLLILWLHSAGIDVIVEW